MRTYVITGTLLGKKNGKRTAEVEAEGKQEIWNNPEEHGFAKIYSVEEKKEGSKG